MKEIIKEKINLALNSIGNEIGIKLAIDEGFINVFDSFTTVSYNSVEYLETKSISSALVGNKPLIVNNQSHEIYQLIDSDVDFENINFKELVELKKIEKITT